MLTARKIERIRGKLFSRTLKGNHGYLKNWLNKSKRLSILNFKKKQGVNRRIISSNEVRGIDIREHDGTGRREEASHNEDTRSASRNVI